MKKPTPEEIKEASKKAVANMNKTLKTWHPTALKALENLRYSYNNFIPNKDKKK